MNAELVNPYIKTLIGDDNALGLEDLKHYLDEQKVSREELGTVITDDLLDSLCQYVNGGMTQLEILPGSDSLRNDKGRTEVFFWGMKCSGKTSVIGTLLASQPQLSETLNSAAALKRSRSLCEAFAETGCNILSPIEIEAENPSFCSVINADFKDKKGDLHPFALIEMNEMTANRAILKQTKNDKIHILCYDSTKSGFEQDNAFISLLNQLKNTEVLTQSVGVYLLVTKCDTFANKQISYRDETAQSLITQEHLNLWTTVRNICAEMQISDATPITYCIGEVRLKRLLKVDLTYARQLIEKPLSLKSNAYRSAVGEVLMAGSLPLTALLLTMVSAAIIYLIYITIPGVSSVPTDTFTPTDFKEYFMAKEQATMPGKTYYSGVKDFRKLYDELQTEKHVKLKNKKNIISHSDWQECEAKLFDDFAEAICGGFRYEFNNKWDEATLEKLRKDAELLLGNGQWQNRKRDALNSDLETLREYYLAKELAEEYPDCDTQEEVDEYKERVEGYRREPFTNCKWLMTKLDEVERRAEKSYDDNKYSNPIKDFLREIFE